MAHRFHIERRNTLTGHRGSVYCIAAGSEWLYSGGGDGWIVRWNAEGSQSDGLLLAEATSSIFSLLFLSDVGILVAGDMAGHLYWIDVQQKKVLNRVAWHKGSIFHLIRIGSEFILSTSADGSICLWDIAHRQPVQSLVLSSQGLRTSWFDGQGKIYTGASDCHIYKTDLASWSSVESLAQVHKNSIFCVEGLGESHLLSGGRDARLCLWDRNSGELLAEQAAHWYTINAICPLDSSCIATASRDKTIRFWGLPQLEILATADIRTGGHKMSVNALLWDENRHFLFSASDDKTIVIWEPQF